MSKTFCILPFTRSASTNDGNYRVCCYSEEHAIKNNDGTTANMRRHDIKDVWNNDFYKNLRLDLINGVQNSACNYCWELENKGAYSHRQKAMEDVKWLDVNPQELIDDCVSNNGSLSTMPVDLDLKIGTLCNLKCIMCYPGSSSMHKDEYDYMRQFNMEPPETPIFFLDRMNNSEFNIDDFNPKNASHVGDVVANLDSCLKELKHLSIVGGEPLVNKTTTRLLEHCIDKNYAKDISLQLITNLSVINKKTLDLLNQFKLPMLNISYDHVDPVKFNFIRFPADYKTFTYNLDTVLADKHILTKFSTTWGIFNIFDIEQIFAQYEKISQRYVRPLTINYGMIVYPNYFNLGYLEPEQKEQIKDIINNVLKHDYKIYRENKDMVNMVRSVYDFCSKTPDDFSHVVRERTRVLRMYDSIRGTDYKKLYPYLKDYE